MLHLVLQIAAGPKGDNSRQMVILITMTKYWLIKSEPSCYSIDDFAKEKVTAWDGVRNYQARNYLRDMAKNDKALFYHSSEEPIGIAGISKVVREAYPEGQQFDRKSPYYDGKSTADNPRWFSPDLKFERKFKDILTLAELRKEKKLSRMELLKKGSRLSVQPVRESEFREILDMAEKKK